jgi:UDP-N-acetylglucosamine--N-acetylmuramyl-(pentapeptide) pyrophosphoryl-undecaprenol N-acetylglucosamine transferase
MAAGGIFSLNYVLAAGGTGGHMMPAHALAEELMRRGHTVALITDERGARIPGLFEGVEVQAIPAGRLGGGPVGWLKAGRQILSGRQRALAMYRDFNPSAVVGFGGYPAFPALLAARARRIPTVIHEQNAVLGRVNRLVARRVDAIAIAYPDVLRLPPAAADKVELVGNPVRTEVLALGETVYPAPDEEGTLNILVTGGSQGAMILSDVVPDGIGMLPGPLKKRLRITQQCRAEDVERVRARYAELGIEAGVAAYLPDLPAHLAKAHLVIGRAGASTIAELTVAGRPAILIPFAAATDDHQTANAREMVAAGAAKAIEQHAFTPETLAAAIDTLGLDPASLQTAADAARSCGRPDAAAHLADLVERVGRTPAPQMVGATEKKGKTVPTGALAS